VTFERFLALVDNHPRCNMLYDPSHLHLQQMDYLTYIDIYHSRIKAFHVKDAEFAERAQRRLRRLSALAAAGRAFPLAGRRADRLQRDFQQADQYDFDGWAVLEWECCLKDGETGAREGSEFIRRHIIPVSDARLMISPQEAAMIQVGDYWQRVYWPGAYGGAAAAGDCRGGGAVRRLALSRRSKSAALNVPTPTTALRRCWRIRGYRWCITVRRTICMPD
jgi:hypothetical protein